jgi:hypothetical protein
MSKKLLLLLFVMIAINASGSENRTALVRVQLPKDSGAILQQIQSMNADIASSNSREGRLDVFLTAEQQQRLIEQGIEVHPLIDDIEAFARQLRESDYLSHFYNEEQIVAELQQAALDYPSIASLHDIGDSYLKQTEQTGHDVWALKISDDVAADDSTEADVLFMANIHAREIITPGIILYFMHYLLENYQHDPYVTHLVNNREIWLIPTLNPDGLAHVFTGDAEGRDSGDSRNPLWWRKNMRDNDGDGLFSPYIDGVDLNRNFGYQWGFDNEGSSPSMGSETYRGTGPFSEPETQIIRDFVKQHHFVIALSYHSYSNLWLYPWGYTFEPLAEPALSVFKELADSCVAYNGYTAQPGADLYTTNGDSDDWLWAECGIYAFTPEVGRETFDGFFPDTSRIMPLILENLGPNLFMTYVAGEEPRITCQPTSEEVAASEPFIVQASIRQPIVLKDSVELDTASFALFWRAEHQQEFSKTSFIKQSTGDFFQAEIPANMPAGKIYFYAEAKDKNGRRGVWPRGAPMAVDSFLVKIADRVNEQNAPQTAALLSNFPNPFNSSTLIDFFLPNRSEVRLEIFDVNGRRIKMLMQGTMAQGQHQVEWNGVDEANRLAASGVYYCRLRTGVLVKSIKLLLIK